MAPRWVFSPIDAESLSYLRRTGRTAAEVQLVERYAKEQQLFRTDDAPVPVYTKTLSLDLGTVVPSLAGPKRPQDRVALTDMKQSFRKSLVAPIAERGYALDEAARARTGTVQDNGDSSDITHGAVVIAAITSCTNTSNPSVMVAAGLLAQKAAAKGLKAKPYVKTSLAPGSRVVTDYLQAAGLEKALDSVGFYTVGYGCTTCIGNSGPLPEPVAKAVTDGNLVASAVISGNRNFEGRVNPLVKANYLASPPLVVAYALAGIDGRSTLHDGTARHGLRRPGPTSSSPDIWPTRLAKSSETMANVPCLPEHVRSISYGNCVWDLVIQMWNADRHVSEAACSIEWKPERARTSKSRRSS